MLREQENNYDLLSEIEGYFINVHMLYKHKLYMTTICYMVVRHMN